MPPEMITIVAPIAMIAKKLASVAVCTSVFEFQKLLTTSPVRRSTCEPASSVSADASRRTTHDHEPDLLRREQPSDECQSARVARRVQAVTSAMRRDGERRAR